MSTPYIVSARKYRPSTFRSVVGQPSLTLTLKNAIESKRLAQAYLFCGPRGVGKTSCARIFAKTINCEHPTPEGEACNECESCRAFNEGRSINIVELDAASNNGVENIRSLNDQVCVPPQSGRYRVFIIDEVHMLSTGAFNAFLKTLEEPPSYVIFILATTEKHKVIPTILSRCQIYDFNRIGVNDIAEHLAYVAKSEGITAEPAALGVIARKADGAMRDALSIFDQVSASCRGNITYQGAIANLNVLDYEFYFRLVDAFLTGDVPSSLLIYKEVRDKGFDSLSFISGLATHLRELMVAAVPQTLPLLEVSADVAERYSRQASLIKPQWAYAAMEAVNFCDINYRTTSNKQFLVELTLIRLCQLTDPPGATDSKGTPSRPALRQPTSRPANAPADTPQTPAAAPTPQPDQAPASQAATPVIPATTVYASVRPAPICPALATRRKTMKISLNDTPTPQSVSEQPAEPTQVTTSAPQPVAATAPPAVVQAWELFAKEHPTHVLLNSAMRSCPPKPTDTPGRYNLTVTKAQADIFENAMTELLAFMRERTGIADFALEFTVDTTARPVMPTRREAYDRMLAEHPAVREILDSLGATLVE